MRKKIITYCTIFILVALIITCILNKYIHNASIHADMVKNSTEQKQMENTVLKSKISFEYSTEGAELIGIYSKNNELQYMNVDIMGELGREIYEYTYLGDRIFITHFEVKYIEPIYVQPDAAIDKMKNFIKTLETEDE